MLKLSVWSSQRIYWDFVFFEELMAATRSLSKCWPRGISMNSYWSTSKRFGLIRTSCNILNIYFTRRNSFLQKELSRNHPASIANKMYSYTRLSKSTMGSTSIERQQNLSEPFETEKNPFLEQWIQHEFVIV